MIVVMIVQDDGVDERSLFVQQFRLCSIDNRHLANLLKSRGSGRSELLIVLILQIPTKWKLKKCVVCYSEKHSQAGWMRFDLGKI